MSLLAKSSMRDAKVSNAKLAGSGGMTSARAGERNHNSGTVWQSLALRPPDIQAKLTVSQPGDPYEREADHVADRVMRMESPASGAGLPFNSGIVEGVQRKCNECEEEEEGSLQRTAAPSASAPAAAPSIVHQTLASSGAPLDQATRALMEPRFGHDFGDVRVHTGKQAAQSARAVNALAYTVGRNIVFRESQYAPATDQGQRLLAHELAHVTQQSSGHVQVARRMGPPAPDEEIKTKARMPVGTSGTFKGNPTAALAKWDYVVYQDHVKLGNRKVDETKGGPVMGSLPWLTNNPGDLTGDLKPRKEKKENPKSAYWQDKRIWGDPIQRGPSPESMSDLKDSEGLSPENTAVQGFAVRGDLAIFADPQRGRRGLQEWIEKNYTNLTLRESVKKHLGVEKATQYKNTAHVDDPEKYPKLLQEFLSYKGYANDYVAKTKGADVKSGEWNDVIDAFGFAEGFFNRRPVAGQKGKFQYVENKGIVYRCSGRDPIDVDPVYRELSRVKNMPQDTPPEIKELLGCE